MAIRREMFRKSLEFVAVRPIRLTSTEFIQPGQLIDKNKFKVFQIQRWYNLRRIGVKGSDWVSAMLSDGRSTAKPEVTGKIMVEQDESKVKRGRKPKTEESPVVPTPPKLDPMLNLKLPNV